MIWVLLLLLVAVNKARRAAAGQAPNIGLLDTDAAEAERHYQQLYIV